MNWYASLSSGSREKDEQQENIETAIRLYENARSQSDEEKWLGILEKAFRSLFIFTEKDFNEARRARHKQRRNDLLDRFHEKVQLRRSGRISRFELARDLRYLCILYSAGIESS